MVDMQNNSKKYESQYMLKLFTTLLGYPMAVFIVGCFGFYGISTFVGYLMLNPFLYK